ncbi:hypothetical protein FPV67DRAFT_1415389 [Lyophyllum atratum]|nr:hypothetical protein FPV67DRAFT_1415389 [Lyophyllum atratum]
MGQETAGACCRASAFRFHILGPPRHPWNKSAARVFAIDFVRFHKLEPRANVVHEIMESFFTRIKSLIYKYKKTLSQDPKITSQKLRRAQRKRNVRSSLTFHSRDGLEITQSNYYLEKHTRMIQQLGVDGMSSDESDNEDARQDRRIGAQRPKFRVLLPQWRAREMTQWLHVFDSVYNATRRIVGATKGDYPRIRHHNDRTPWVTRSDHFVPDLPLCAYRQEWLDSHGTGFVEMAVRPTGDAYQFTHDNELIRQVIHTTQTNL